MAPIERPCVTGDRVVLTGTPEWRGTVSFVRSGFASVRWDHGSTTSEWAAELAPERGLTREL
jgi:hypothetical protein